MQIGMERQFWIFNFKHGFHRNYGKSPEYIWLPYMTQIISRVVLIIFFRYRTESPQRKINFVQLQVFAQRCRENFQFGQFRRSTVSIFNMATQRTKASREIVFLFHQIGFQKLFLSRSIQLSLKLLTNSMSFNLFRISMEMRLKQLNGLCIIFAKKQNWIYLFNTRTKAWQIIK